MRDSRLRLRSALAPIAAGYGLALLIATPLLVYALLGLPDRSFTAPDAATTDAVDLVLPTEVNALGAAGLDAFTKSINTTEAGLYLGVPTLLIVIWFAWRERRSRPAQVLVAALALSILVALGSKLRVSGDDLVALPGWVARHVPGLENARLNRVAAYASLAAALVVALWTATMRGRSRALAYVLPALAILALVPTLGRAHYVEHVQRVPFFADGLYRSCLGQDENVAVFPYGHAGDSMLWQAESGFGFRLAGGYLYPLVLNGPSLTRFDDDPAIRVLNFRSDVSVPTMDNLLAFAGAHDVDRFVSVAGTGYPSAEQMRRFGSVQRIGGVLVAPACGSLPLTTRDLGRFVAERDTDGGSNARIAYCLDGYMYELSPSVGPAGLLAGATRASFVAGKGLTCEPHDGYRRRGFATATQGVRPHTYPYYTPP